MTPLVLKPHPDSGVTAVRRIEATAALSPIGKLSLVFALSGEVGAVRVPARTAPERTDGLWRRTCFEAFLRSPRAHGYFELNFSPSTQWAAYQFRAYREDMAAAEIGAPGIVLKKSARKFELQASVDLAALPGARERSTWRLGLAAIIEETDGAKSYWALAHPPGKPDFHHRDGFAHELTRETR